MIPLKTFELRIVFLSEGRSSAEILATKELVMSWLVGIGVESFVEGAIDDIYVDHRYDQSLSDFYTDMGGANAPLSIYDYNLEFLSELKTKLLFAFPEHLKVEEHSMDSEVWMEGWKESFKPIFSDKFCIHPPWDKPSKTQLMYIDIEPGMAFGTGQHATTQLCMRVLEGLPKERVLGKRCLDVGTGTGVLAIAAKMLGFKEVIGTDIDHLAVESATYNCKVNNVDVTIWSGSCPEFYPDGRPFQGADLVIANILPIVLFKILPDLARVTSVGGLLILSGILIEHVEEMTLACQSHQLQVIQKADFEGWGALVLEKKKYEAPL